jgi:hypothetical protein
MPVPYAGEFISVASQKDSEEADIEKERLEQLKGPEARERELEELTQIYVNVRRVMPAGDPVMHVWMIPMLHKQHKQQQQQQQQQQQPHSSGVPCAAC